MYWAVSAARLQMLLFLELKFPAKAVSIVPVVVSHRLVFSYHFPLFFETFVRLFKKPILNFLTIYPTVQRRLGFNKI